MSAKSIYKYSQYFGRAGRLTGIFVAKADDVQMVMGEICLGVVLGQHSDVWADLNSETLKLVTDNRSRSSWKMVDEYLTG